MEFTLKGFSYSVLLSHMLPGTVFELEIIAFIDAVSPRFDLFRATYYLKCVSMTGIIVFVIVFLLVAAFLGVVVDAMHHFIFAGLENRKRGDLSSLMKYIKTPDDFEVMRCVILDCFWYPYEAFANASVVLIVAAFVLPVVVLHYSGSLLAVFVGLLIPALLSCVTIVEAKRSIKNYHRMRPALIKALKSSHPRASKGGS